MALSRFVLGLAPAWVLFSVGCGSSAENTDPVQAETQEPSKTNEQTAKPPAKPKPDPDEVWKKLVAGAEAQLEAGEMEAAALTLEALAKVYEDPDQPTDEQKAKRQELENRLDEARRALVAQKRIEDLTEAERLMTLGKFTEATQKVNDVIAAAPTSEQRQKTNEILAEITRLRKARRDLRTWVQLLELEDPSSIATAQTNLLGQPDVALGMMIEASEDVEKPILAGNSLEVLRLLNRPEATLPAMIAVLKRPQQEAVWQEAIREIGRVNQAGAGEPLLELVLASENPNQRIAAMKALANVPDIPNRTLIEVLPFILADGPELASALNLAYHAIRLHDQFDYAAHRGFERFLTAEQSEKLSQLPKRLSEILERNADDEQDGEVVQAAKVLAVATHQIPAEPLENVKVLRAEAESPDGPAAAVLDGVWNSVDLTKMWRHAISQRSTITLDLGETRTVAGVKIWNFNQQSGSHRGWKEVEIFVSDSPTALTPLARGVLLRAPGSDNPPDYSTTIPVPFARGRYVRLYAKSLWASDSYTGLSEIDVLGF